MKLILVLIENNLYKIELTGGMKPMNELPNIRFERNDQNKIIGLSFVHDDGKEEFVRKE